MTEIGRKVVKVKDVKDIVPVIQTEVKPTLFTIIDYLTIKKKSWEQLTLEEKKLFNPFMINRFLSMDLKWIELLNALQRYSLRMDKKECYIILFNLLPKQKFYLKYIKIQNEISDKDLFYLSKEYPISRQELEEYYIILTASEEGRAYLKKLKASYAYEKPK